MNTINWKYARPLANPELLERFETECGIRFPKAFVEVALAHNAGRPFPNTFDTPAEKGMVFQSLITFGDQERRNMFSVYRLCSKTLPSGYIPFADDPFGNLLCFRIPAVDGDLPVYFWDHESSESSGLRFVAKSFGSLLDSLY